MKLSPVETVRRYLVRLWSYGDILGLKIDRKLDLRDGIRFAGNCGYGTEREQGTSQGQRKRPLCDPEDMVLLFLGLVVFAVRNRGSTLQSVL